MKAIVIKPPFSTLILQGKKTLETRKWRFQHRGELLIVAGKSLHGGECLLDGVDMDCVDLYKKWFREEVTLHQGKGICVVTVTGCRPMTLADEAAACCRWYEGAFVWELGNMRPVVPFPVQGQQGIMNVEDELINYIAP
jgi:hypothetical protein